MITPEATPTFLETLPVARIFGVGDVTAARLKDLGITTGKDLKHLGLEHLQELFGKRGTVLYHFVRGEDDRPVEPERERKSAGKETTFERDITERGEMLLALEQGETLVSVRYHRPGQILWSHATCWTEDQPVSADLTTFLYQTNTEPWGEQLTADPERRQTTRRPADERDPTVIAADLTTTQPEESLPDDEPGLLALTRAAALAGENILALSCEDGQRQKQWAGSPVPSNFFRL